MNYPNDNQFRFDDDNRGALMLGRVLAATILALSFGAGMCARKAAAQPYLDCTETSTATIRYFNSRTSYRFCIPPYSTNNLTQWQIKRLDSPTPLWVTAGTSINGEFTIAGLPHFARFQVRYKFCVNIPACDESDPQWSPESKIIVNGPDVDIDNSGVVSVWDTQQVCAQFVNKVSNYNLVGDEYVP